MLPGRRSTPTSALAGDLCFRERVVELDPERKKSGSRTDQFIPKISSVAGSNRKVNTIFTAAWAGSVLANCLCWGRADPSESNGNLHEKRSRWLAKTLIGER